jgi:hypothetical protein
MAAQEHINGIVELLTQVTANHSAELAAVEKLLAESRQTVTSLTAALGNCEQKLEETKVNGGASLAAALDKAKRGDDLAKRGDDLAKAVQAALTKYMGDAAPSGSGGKRGNPNSKQAPAPKAKRVKIDHPVHSLSGRCL